MYIYIYYYINLTMHVHVRLRVYEIKTEFQNIGLNVSRLDKPKK